MRHVVCLLIAGLLTSGAHSLSISEPVMAGLTASYISNTEEPGRRGKPEVDKAVRLLIDTMFGERRVEEAFEQYFRFEPLSPEETHALSQMGCEPSNEIGKHNDIKITARAMTIGWNYAYQPALLALGTATLSGGHLFRKSFERSKVVIDDERERVLSKRGISTDEFYNLLDLKAAKDTKTLQNNLATLESINGDMARFIEQRINKITYERNIVEMKKGYTAKTHRAGTQTFYEVGFKPMFKVVFIQHNGRLKMISFGDVL